MRALLAGLFVFSAMLATVGVISANYPGDKWPWWTIPAPFAVLLVSSALALYVFNGRGYRPNFPRRGHAERIADLDSHGLLERQSFRALRCFQIDAFEDEGVHYYIELDDGRVLLLSGQYLYDFEPITDDPEVNQPREFPCGEFEVLRHKTSHYVLDILCKGVVLEPELRLPPYSMADMKRGVPEDGEIISNRSYDEIKRERQAAAMDD